MLNILVVEDEPLLAATLKHLIELNPLHVVTAVTDDCASAIAAVEERRPDLALVDLQLANGSTGFTLAAKLAEMEIPCLFTSGKAPSFPMPDLALGCLVKPFTQEDLVRALKTAEDLIRGRERLRPSRPQNLRLYSDHAGAAEEAAFLIPRTGRPSLKMRLAKWWAAA